MLTALCTPRPTYPGHPYSDSPRSQCWQEKAAQTLSGSICSERERPATGDQSRSTGHGPACLSLKAVPADRVKHCRPVDENGGIARRAPGPEAPSGRRWRRRVEEGHSRRVRDGFCVAWDADGE